MLKRGMWIFLTFMFVINNLTVHAEALNHTSSRIEGELVVDVSHSMLSSDPNKLSNEAMKMFVDMSSLKGDKIGVIAYANDVVSQKEMVKIQSEQDKQTIKTFIDSLEKYSNTDISNGMTEAVKQLSAHHERGYVPLIVLLADGNNELDKTKTKTLKQADDQLAQAVVDAKAKGYPVYVIGLNANGKLNRAVLQKIADQTSGKFFETSNANDLPGILNEIFADHLKLKEVPIKNVTATDQFQDIKITIPNENVLEANISLISSKPVDLKLVDPARKEQPIPSGTITLSKSKNYSMLKLLNPVQGDWILKVKGFPQDKIDIHLVFNNDLQLQMSSLPETIAAGQTAHITAQLIDNGKGLINKNLYKTLKASAFLKNVSTGKMEEFPLRADNQGFNGQIKFADPGDYEVTVKAEGNSFYRVTHPQKVTIYAAGTASDSVAGDTTGPLQKIKQLPWLYLIAGAAGVILLVRLGALIARKRRENRGFSGQIIVEVKDESTGASLGQQMKKLKSFKGEFQLRQLFLLEPEFKAVDQITFVPITDNTLLLLNKSDCLIDKDGEEIDAESGHRLRRNDKLRISLKERNKAIYIQNVS